MLLVYSEESHVSGIYKLPQRKTKYERRSRRSDNMHIIWASPMNNQSINPCSNTPSRLTHFTIHGVAELVQPH